MLGRGLDTIKKEMEMIAAPIKTQIWKCNQKSHQHPQMSTAMRCIEDDIRKEEKRQAYNKKIEAAHAKKRKIFLSVLNGLTVADAAQKFTQLSP